MPITVELLHDRVMGGGPPSLTSTIEGWTGKRVYRVSTPDAEEALATAAVPRMADPWSAAYPTLKVVQIETEWLRGEVGPGGNGHTLLKYQYRSPSLRNGGISPDQYARFVTRVGVEMRTQLIVYAPGDVSGALPLFNGQGYNKPVGFTILDVYTYWPMSAPYDFSRLGELVREQAYNADAVDTPPILNAKAGIRYSLAPGQAQYVGYQATVKLALLEIVHRVAIAPDFAVSWPIEDRYRRFTGSMSPSVYLHKKLPFVGLW